MTIGTTVQREEMQARIIDRLVDELDPRNYVETRAFLKNLQPMVADAIADHFRRYSRLMLETAFTLREIMARWEIASDDWKASGEAHDFLNGQTAMLCAIHPQMLKGYSEVEEAMESLHAFDDDGFAIILDNANLKVAEKFLDEEGWNELVTKQLELDTA